MQRRDVTVPLGLLLEWAQRAPRRPVAELYQLVEEWVERRPLSRVPARLPDLVEVLAE